MLDLKRSLSTTSRALKAGSGAGTAKGMPRTAGRRLRSSSVHWKPPLGQVSDGPQDEGAVGAHGPGPGTASRAMAAGW